MEFLFGLVLLIAGGAIGCVITQIIFRHNTAYGYFVLDPIEDPDTPGMYTVGVKFDGSDLREKDKVILHKQKSQE